MNSQLQDIVDRAYVLFGHYHLGKDVDACTVCCLKKEEEQQLINQNVRSLPSDLLMKWNHAAKPIEPEINVFKHLLPRFLDLTAQFDFPSHSREITLKSFGYFPRSRWLQSELRLIDEFCFEFFKDCLARFPIPGYASIEEILIMISKANAALEPLLEFWLRNVTNESAIHFAELFALTHWGEATKSHVNGFAGKGYLAAVRPWIRQRDVANAFFDRIEEICFGTRDFEWEVEQQLEFTLDNLPKYL